MTTEVQKKGLRMVLLTLALSLALYLSGFFVFLTAMPLVFFLIRYPLKDYWPYLAGMCGFLLVMYFAGIGNWQQLYESYPSLRWLLPIPGIELLPNFSEKLVRFVGLGYFFYHFGIAFAIYMVFFDQKKNLFKQMVSLLAPLFILGALVFAFLYLGSWDEFLNQFRTYITVGVQELINVQDRAESDAAQITYLKSQIPTLVEYSVFLSPAFIISSLIFVFALNLSLSRRFFLKLHPKLKNLRLTAFQVPFEMVWVVIAVILGLLNLQFFENNFLLYVFLNVLIVSASIYFFQGLCTLIEFLNRKKIFGLMRFAIYMGLLLFLQPIVILIVFFGFFDHWMDTRKLNAGTS